MNNSQYWQKRAEQISNIQFKKADKLSRNIAKEYQKAEKYIQERINLYYARYAKEYGVDLADAKILLSPSELNNFKMTIEEFRKKAIENDDGKWTKELDEEYLRSRISRLEALKMDINNKIYELSGKVNEETEEHLKKVYKDTYLRNITTYGDELGIGNNFERLNDDVINKAIYTRWTNEKNFAGRLDDNKKTLLSSINKTITQGLITGASSDTMVEKLMKETKVSRNRAINIVQTETTFIIGQANTQMYKDFGVEEYEIIETLDSVTCETCAEMDGKIGKVSEKVEGVNAPPFHPRCRGTTIPVSKYAKIWGNEQRIARDDKGDISYTNAKNYKEWQKENENKVTKSNNSSKMNETSILQQLKNSKIEYNKVEKLKKPLTEEEIIAKVSGGDMTGGSCSSATLAYIANKHGLDVCDFRGGESRSFFATSANVREITKLTGVKSIIEENYNDILGAMNLLKQITDEKEYYFAVGKHATIIKMVEDHFEYLELQSPDNNGFKRLTTGALKNRFDCKQSHSVQGIKVKTKSFLIETDSLKGNKEFEELLGYLNTVVTGQKKGASGIEK